MQTLTVDFLKYQKLKEENYFHKLGKVVNVVGLTVESAGPDAKLGDICSIFPEGEDAKPVMAEVVGFKDKKTLLMPYEAVDGIGLNCLVQNLGIPLSVEVSDNMLGRTLDGLGRRCRGAGIIRLRRCRRTLCTERLSTRYLRWASRR